MNDRQRRAFAAWIIGVALLPDPDGRRMEAIPNDRRARFLRALGFLALTLGESEEEATASVAARVAGIPRGTVASWLSRSSDFRKLALAQIELAAREYECLEWDPLTPEDLAALDRVQELPEIELARVAVGEIPSRRFMATAFPPGADFGASEYEPRWLEVFPRHEEKR